MKPVEFKPSDVHLAAVPLTATMGRAEREQAAALIVRVCQAMGDRWQPVTWNDVRRVLTADLAEPAAHITADWVRWPLFRPDVRDLCDKGFATLDGDAASFTEVGFAKLRAHVKARAGEHGIPRPRPQFMLVPVEAHYRPGEALDTRDGLELHRADPPIEVQAWKVPVLSSQDEELPDLLARSFGTVELQRSHWTQEIRWSPRERRKIARWEGRGKAKPIPMATRHTVEVYAPTKTPSPVIGALIGTQVIGAPPTLAIWRCRGWRRGAHLWISGASK